MGGTKGKNVGYPGALSDEEIGWMVSVLSADNRIEGAVLHGSAANGLMRPESDVDIAILPAQGAHMNGMELAELGATLTAKAGRIVDVGIISAKNLVYAREAILHGRLLFTRSRFAFDLAAATLLGMYARFHDDRQVVLHAYSS